MGWADCGNDSRGRPIGYGFQATCDHPGCETQIDRGLGYACGGMHGGGDPDYSCDGYFCEDHRSYSSRAHAFLCVRCAAEADAGLDEEPDDAQGIVAEGGDASAAPGASDGERVEPGPKDAP